MRPVIIVDANPIISALLGGLSREVFFNHHFEFMTTSFTLKEVEKYLPYISEKSEVSISFLQSLLRFLPLAICEPEEYALFIPKAKKLITDEKDVAILALALAKRHPLWSNDKHFEGITEINLIKTKDFA